MTEAMAQAARGWNLAHVVLLLLDSERAAKLGKLDANLGKPLTNTELSLASKVVKEGRALLILINKLDTLEPALCSPVRLALCVPSLVLMRSEVWRKK
jgi:predicted GTPase